MATNTRQNDDAKGQGADVEKPDNTPEDDEQTYIEYRQKWTDEQGKPKEKVHRVKSEDWAKYEKKHGF